MAKGSMVDQFCVGQAVQWQDGNETRRGRIVKLHRSGSTGVAELKPMNGDRKKSRKLQYVSKLKEEIKR